MIRFIRKHRRRSEFDIISNRRDNELNLQKLTPGEVEDMNYYQEALDFAFNEFDVLNIAITGPYGAGKSSVVETYKKLYPDKKFIHISLTNFQQVYKKENKKLSTIKDSGEKEIKKDKELDENELEGKILNQLIHQIDPKNIPQTEFKIKTDITWLKIIKETFPIALFLVFLLYIIKFTELQLVVDKLGDASMTRYLNILVNYNTFIFSTIICFIIFTFYLYRIIRTQLYKPIFKKVKWQNNEIEIFESDDESYFNKHLDEILYLFRNSDVDIIVFEDIDRYDNNIIFSKLREINDLINNEINNKDRKKPIKFLYLIRDDIFASKDRTKFFDFIIPVIPVIDSSNSYDKLLEHFGKVGPLNNDGRTFLSELDDYFLRDISLYIDDMRLLKNIYNEYVIYYGRLQIIELDPNKLLALIIYKNIFPKDFIELQLNKGLVFDMFENKEFYIKEKIKKIDLNIQELHDNINIIKNEFLNDLDELDTLYLTSGQYNYNVGGRFDDSFNTRLEYIKEIKKSTSTVLLRGSLRNIQEEITNFSNDPNYVERKNTIEQKMNADVDKLKEETIKLKLEKDIINSSKLKEIISKDNIDYIFEYQFRNEDGQLIKYEDIINNHYYPLIRYLIRNGYIDETYFDYLSYFYENSLTRNDKIFLRSITDGVPKEHNYKLKDPSKIVTYLKPISLEQKEALNFDLLEYLLDNNHEYLLYLLQQIKDNRLFDFVWNYIVQASSIDKLVKELNIIWKDLWVYLTSIKDIENEKKKDYMIYTLNYSSITDIQTMNINDCITTYISKDKNFLDINNPNVNKIIDIFISLEICFENINYSIANKDLFEEVYKNDLYELNFSIIELILEKIYDIPYNSDYKEINYTLISSQPDQPLKKYIDRNINKYMEVLFNNSTDKFRDPEDIVISILNNQDIEDNNKLKYIQNLSTVIFDLEEIKNNEFWEELFKYNLVNYSSENILKYYFCYSNKIDRIIINYLNDKSDEIKFEYEVIQRNFADQDVSKFFIDVIKNNGLTNLKYEMILKEYRNSINNFNINGIQGEKFEILIKLNIISMTKENIEFVRSIYPNLIVFFISNNIQDYIDFLDEEILIEQEILDVLNEEGISDENKISLAKKIPNNISLKDSKYRESLQLYIIKNKFRSSDLSYLIDSYNNSSTEMKCAIKELCITYIEDIILNKCILSYNLLLELTPNMNIGDRYKKIIIFNSIERLNGTEVRKLMFIAMFYDFASLFERRRPKIEITDENYNLLKYFEHKGWITKFEEDEDNEGYYRVIGRDYEKIRKNSISNELL